ncbi:MAG: hypothetical protein IPL27_27475 [Lewinellaceae bacterium]|nr:hypothetical protein [Lewinellaceae bacterium]
MKKNPWIGRVLIALLVICIAAAFSLNYYAKWRIQKEIERFSAQNSKGVYSLSVGNTYLNVWNGVLKAADIVVTTDTAKWAAIRQTWPDSFPPVIQMSVGSVEILHVNMFRYLFSKKIEMRAINFQRPILKITRQRDTTQRDSVLLRTLAELPDLLAPVSKALKINEISVNHADITLHTWQERDTVQQYLTDVNLLFSQIDIDKASAEVTYCKDIAIQLGHFETRSNEGTHLVSLDSFYLSKNSRKISLRRFSVAPLQTEQEFFRQQPFRKAYIAFICPEMTLTGFDMDRLLRHNYFSADTLQVDQAKLILTSNKLLPLPYRKILPNEAVRKITGLFNIKNVVMKDCDIGVTTKEPDADFLVTFNHTYVTANNLTNDSMLMDEQRPFDLWVESKFMNRAPIKMNMRIPLLSPALQVDYTATIRNFPLAALNPVISHKNLMIETGYVQKTEINTSVRNGVARGTVKIHYKDLKVKVLREDSRKVRRLMTKIAELFVNEENMLDGDPETPFKTGTIYHVRNRQEEFFVFLWHALQTGLLPTIVPAYDKLKK